MDTSELILRQQARNAHVSKLNFSGIDSSNTFDMYVVQI